MSQNIASIVFIIEILITLGVIVWLLIKIKSIADSLKRIADKICSEDWAGKGCNNSADCTASEREE